MSNTLAQQSIDECRRQTTEAANALASYERSKKIIQDAIARDEALLAKYTAQDYGANTSGVLRPRWISSASYPASHLKSSGSEGCTNWWGGHLFNDNGFVVRERYKREKACGPSYGCETRLLNPGDSYDPGILHGCRRAIGLGHKNWRPYTDAELSFSSRPTGKDGCYSSKPQTAHCFKTSATVAKEKKIVQDLQNALQANRNLLAGLVPPTITMNCNICAQTSNSTCAAGAICTVSQVNTCAGAAEAEQKMLDECKAAGGVYDANTKQCILPLAVAPVTPVLTDDRLKEEEQAATETPVPVKDSTPVQTTPIATAKQGLTSNMMIGGLLAVTVLILILVPKKKTVDVVVKSKSKSVVPLLVGVAAVGIAAYAGNEHLKKTDQNFW